MAGALTSIADGTAPPTDVNGRPGVPQASGVDLGSSCGAGSRAPIGRVRCWQLPAVGQDEPMDLTHRFSVPAHIDEAWNAFNNPEELAPCFPGATIDSIEGDEFTGSVKIKLGPVALVYNGSGRYVERNDVTAGW